MPLRSKYLSPTTRQITEVSLAINDRFLDPLLLENIENLKINSLQETTNTKETSYVKLTNRDLLCIIKITY